MLLRDNEAATAVRRLLHLPLNMVTAFGKKACQKRYLPKIPGTQVNENSGTSM